MELQGKRAIITGAASGIGRATAILFACEGAIVTLADVNVAGMEETAAMIGGDVTILPYDAMDAASCKAMIDAGAKDGLDILCNIAGYLNWGSSLDFPIEEFDRVLRINTTSVFALCQAAMPYLIERKGNIVNACSAAALQGIAYTIAYSAAKHGVAAITKGLAIEFAAQGVRVNGICPGHVDTPMTRREPPAGDLDWSLVMRNAPKLADGVCAPEDIANMFLFLASDRARKATGSLVTVDGGQLAG